MKLTHAAIRNARPGVKPKKLFDGGGLFLLVTPKGQHWWRLKYRYQGKEKLLSLGTYPQISLAQARRRREAAKALLADGIDPGDQRKAMVEETRQAEEGSFEKVAEDWLAFKSPQWSNETRRKAEKVTRTYLVPALGEKSIATLQTKDVVPVLRTLATRAPNMARKARQYVQGIARHAMMSGLREDGRVLMLDGVLPTAANKGHVPAATMPEDAAKLMREIHVYPVEVTRTALLMCAYTAQRPGVVVTMRWDEVEIEAGEWRIPAAKMKTRHTHIVPLPKQAKDLLKAMEPYTAGRDYVFPPMARQQTPHLHRDALSKALRTMGFAGKHSTHGFRAMFRTLGRERLNIDSDILEAQLAHAKRGEVQAAYDRTAFTEARRDAMQQWADWLDKLAEGGKVVPIREVAEMADAD